mmetsp:Transcript_16376/g.42210  ORF Transcript_16376/g.42210 Transcript_16376/m.42210 type:complete len:208 (+) Transcript_16376:1762-2385(+)
MPATRLRRTRSSSGAAVTSFRLARRLTQECTAPWPAMTLAISLIWRKMLAVVLSTRAFREKSLANFLRSLSGVFRYSIVTFSRDRWSPNGDAKRRCDAANPSARVPSSSSSWPRLIEKSEPNAALSHAATVERIAATSKAQPRAIDSMSARAAAGGKGIRAIARPSADKTKSDGETAGLPPPTTISFACPASAPTSFRVASAPNAYK